MLTYSSMQAELLSRLQAANNSTLYTTTRLENLIKDAYMWATGLFNWPQLQSAKTTSTVSGQEAYDYPSDFKTDAILRVKIDTHEYNRKNFEDYLDYKDDNPNTTDEYIFADHARQIFVFPTPTANGSSNFSVWGQNQTTQLSGSSDNTIFSTHDEVCNEAVVKKALSVVIKKTNANLAVTEEAEARQILINSFTAIKNRQQRDQRLDHPRFNIPDFFSQGGSSGVGNFSVRP